jgi:hypothetical protein
MEEFYQTFLQDLAEGKHCVAQKYAWNEYFHSRGFIGPHNNIFFMTGYKFAARMRAREQGFGEQAHQ